MSQVAESARRVVQAGTCKAKEVPLLLRAGASRLGLEVIRTSTVGILHVAATLFLLATLPSRTLPLVFVRESNP